MFGYITVFQPEIKMGEFEQYRGVYCALCKQLGKKYGLLSRMTLSYDFTFLALFRMSLDNSCPGFQKQRCMVHPLNKRSCCGQNSQIEFAADMAALMMYYKVKDNVADRGFWHSLPARMLLPFAAHARKKAAKLHPDIDRLMADCMRKQAELEADGCTSIDRAADPTAKMLEAIAVSGWEDFEDAASIRRFGYCLGRWIYLIDAVDDLEEDLKGHSYNAYLLSRKIDGSEQDVSKELEAIRQYSLLTLNACLAECLDVFITIPTQRFQGILLNILKLGMPTQQQKVLTRNKEKSK